MTPEQRLDIVQMLREMNPKLNENREGLRRVIRIIKPKIE